MDPEDTFHTADNLLDFFPVDNRDGLNITWAHAVNSKEELEQALKGDSMMLETDIIVRGFGTDEPTNVPVNAHPPNTDSNITFEEWIDQVLQYPNKGIKLDFKCLEAVEPTLKIINHRRSQIRVPVLLNADIAQGPDSLTDVVVKPNEFLTTCNSNFDMVTMSLGFTTGDDCSQKGSYTWEMIFDILGKVHNLDQPVTFTVRAVYLSTSWQKFVWLLGLKQSYSITVWSNASDWVDMMGLLALRKHASKERVFFDLPEEQMVEFQTALSKGNVVVPEKASSPWNIDLWYIDQVAPRSGNLVFLSTTGVGFIARDPDNPVSQRILSKQVHGANDPLEVSGKVHFTDTKKQSNEEETHLKVYVSSNDPVFGGASNHTVDLLAISIGSSGTICLQDLLSKTYVDASLPSARVYQFTLCKIGIGHTPTLNVTAIGPSVSSVSESVNLVCTEKFAVGSTCLNLGVGFSQVGTSKDLLVEEFGVKG